MHIHTASYHRELRQRRKELKLPLGAQRLLAVFEGVEGGFAIGAGIVVGLVAATADKNLIILTAAIGLLVSGFSSAAVKYGAEHYNDELDGSEKKNPVKYYFMPALYEFIAYLITSAAVLLPLFLMTDIYMAATVSVAITLLTLFASGVWRGYLMRRHHKLRDGLELVLLGILIVLVGGISGWLLTSLV